MSLPELDTAQYQPIALAALKRELKIGQRYKLTDRQGTLKPFGEFETDTLPRTVVRVQTNALVADMPGQKDHSWLYFSKGDKAYRSRLGFVIELGHGESRLFYEWLDGLATEDKKEAAA